MKISFLYIIFNIIGIACFAQQNQWMIINSSNSCLPTNNISELSIDDSNNFWIIKAALSFNDTIEGIIKFSASGCSIITTAMGNIKLLQPKNLSIDLNNRLWFVASDPSILFWAFWGYKDGDWKYFNSANSSLPGLMNSVTVDLNNNKWMIFLDDYGDDYIGRLQYDSSWRFWKANLSILNTPFKLKLTAIDPLNNLWIGGNQGLTKFDGISQTFYQMPPPIGQYPQQVCIGKNGVIWIIGGWTWDHLVKFQYGLYTHHTSIKGQCGTVDKYNVLWIGSEDKLLKFDGNNWTIFTSSNSPLPANNGVSCISIDNYGNLVIGLVSINNQPNTGGLVLHNPNGIVLPVEFKDFKIEVSGTSVKITWSTATELNNKGFDIQMSFDNMNFDNVGFVPGFGTSSEMHSYNFEVNDLKDGKYYFRLAQVDYDGTVSYSQTIEVEIIQPKEFSLSQNYPNPFNPSTKIKYSVPALTPSLSQREKVQLFVYDVLGNVVATLVDDYLSAGTYEVEFSSATSIQHLVSGIWHLEFTCTNCKSENKF